MKLLLIVSLIYIVLFVAVCIFSQFIRFDITNKNYALFMTILIVSLSVVSFFSTDNSEDTSGWDINRYYADINGMRGKNIAYAFQNGLYKTSYVTNFLFFIVSRLNNNAWLQVISTSVSLTIFSYVILSKVKSNGLIFSDIALYMLLMFSFVGFSVMLVGVRWILALSVSALAVNIEERKHSNNLSFLSVLLYFIAFFTHYGIIFFIIVRICTIGNFKWVKYFLPFLLLGIVSMDKLSQYSEIFEFLYARLKTYTGLQVQDIRVMIVKYIMFSIMFINEINQREDCKNNLGINLLSSTLGTLPVQYLFTRMISVYIVTMPNKLLIGAKKNNMLRYIISILCIGLLAYQIVFIKTFWRFTIL